MRTGRLLNMLTVAGILSIVGGGCGSSEIGGVKNSSPSGDGSGGTVTKPGEGRSGGSDTAQGAGGTAMVGTTGGGGSTRMEAPPGSGGASNPAGESSAVGGSAGPGNAAGTQSSGKGGRRGESGGAGRSASGAGGRASGVAGSASGGTGGSVRGAGGRANGAGGASSSDAGSSGRGGGATGGGTCTASKDAGKSVSGSGPHKVTIETNSDTGISAGTIYRPTDLGGTEKYPIFIWGEGGCSQNGLSNQAAMGEIASHGYFIVADGTPGGTSSGSTSGDAKAFLAYITWAIAENDKPCSAYYQSLDTTKIAVDGFSCGGLMSENASGDSRVTAVGITSSGLFSANQALYKKIHTPFKILLGGSGDMAYENGERDFDGISALGIPILLLSKDGAGHGGDLGRATGDFNTINLAWLNWQLKGDEGATGKGLLVGPSCKYCNASGWEFKSKNIE